MVHPLSMSKVWRCAIRARPSSKGCISRPSSAVRYIFLHALIVCLTMWIGNSSDYASPITQNAWFADVSGAIMGWPALIVCSLRPTCGVLSAIFQLGHTSPALIIHYLLSLYHSFLIHDTQWKTTRGRMRKPVKKLDRSRNCASNSPETLHFLTDSSFYLDPIFTGQN
jgi:hypothetical protein